MNDPRGSIWRKCDFHIHTPFSHLGHDFGSDFNHYVQTLFRTAIEKQIQVIGITDYFTIDGYKKIKTEYLNDDQKLESLFNSAEIQKIKDILVLPNIEFRLNKIVQIIKINGTERKTENGRINFHVILSDQIPIKTIEENFLHNIDFTYESEPNEKDRVRKLKLDNLTALGKRLKEEQPDIKGTFTEIGMTHAVVDDKEIGELLVSNNDFKEKYFFAIPSDEDLSAIQWKSQDGLTRKILISKAHAILSANPKTIEFGLGNKAASEEEYIKEFKTLKPCIWGSDAHDFKTLFEPVQERYCWIKADPTFEGIRQIFFEPKDRVFIGKYPALYDRIKENRGNYIDSLSINKISSYDGRKGVWFDNFKVKIGFELTAIIGNKGKGKSAIVDILGLLGNAHIDRKDLSFLKNDKFCQKGYGENFIGTLSWIDKSKSEKNLNENIDTTSAERVKYIPQSYLEKLCNDENGGFKEEINKVVFARLEDSDKLGKKSFQELEAFKTELINQKIAELKIKINNINKAIGLLENKLSDDYTVSIANKLSLKRQELSSHEEEKKNIKPAADPSINTNVSEEQREKALLLTSISSSVKDLETKIESESQKLSTSKIILSELELMLNEIKAVQERFEEWKTAHDEQYKRYGLNINDILKLTVDSKKISDLVLIENQKIEILLTSLSKKSITSPDGIEKSLYVQVNTLNLQKDSLEKELDQPLKDWQEYQKKTKEWENKAKEILGSDDTPDTIRFFEKEISYLGQQLSIDISSAKALRNSIVLEIYSQKEEIQAVYNKIKVAISSILQQYSEEQNITIETSFKIDKLFFIKFFDYVNRYGAFYSSGDEELQKIIATFDFNDSANLIAFIDHLFALDIRFKEGRKQDFYNFICSLEFIQPEYDLRLNNKSLNQLSPGEKGGLLLVFYLVLDKDNKPLIIDQPEDNLDNQSVAEILVPYIKNAKKMRQIVMVTHNPNLAIVADAEQIIYMNIDKETDYKVTCNAGGIENPIINNHIVDILEGKMKAFNNRRIKYKG